MQRMWSYAQHYMKTQKTNRTILTSQPMYNTNIVYTTKIHYQKADVYQCVTNTTLKFKACSLHHIVLHVFVHRSLALSVSEKRFSYFSKYIIWKTCSFYATSFCFRSEKIRIFVCESREYEGSVDKCIEKSAPTRDERSWMVGGRAPLGPTEPTGP